MGLYFSSPRIPKIVRLLPKDVVVIQCSALPEAVVKTSEQAHAYAAYFAKQVLLLDDSPVTSVLSCSESCMRSMAVLITFCLWKGMYPTPEFAQNGIRRRQKHLSDVSCLHHYRSAIEMALIILSEKLDV